MRFKLTEKVDIDWNSRILKQIKKNEINSEELLKIIIKDIDEDYLSKCLSKYYKYYKMNYTYDIKSIFLLSIEEYEKYRNLIPVIDNYWWLRSPGDHSYSATAVGEYGSVIMSGNGIEFDDYAVRPALRISNLKSFGVKPGDTLEIFDRDWIVLDKDLVISEEEIGEYLFDEESNDYETSEIKRSLENWLREQKEKYNI